MMFALPLFALLKFLNVHFTSCGCSFLRVLLDKMSEFVTRNDSRKDIVLYVIRILQLQWVVRDKHLLRRSMTC